MALTPEDVANVVFDTTRMRMGYDVSQVDEFLEKVADEIASLQNELEMAHRGTSLSSSQSVDTKSPVEVLTLAQQALTAATNEAERLVREARARAASISSSVELGAQLNDSIENTEPVNVITSAPENQ